MEPQGDRLGAVDPLGGFRPTPSNIVHRSMMFSGKGQTAPQGAGLQLRCRMWGKGSECCPLLAVCRAVKPSNGAEAPVLKGASNEEAIKILPAAIKYEEDVIIQPSRPRLLPTEIFMLLLTSAHLCHFQNRFAAPTFSRLEGRTGKNERGWKQTRHKRKHGDLKSGRTAKLSMTVGAGIL